MKAVILFFVFLFYFFIEGISQQLKTGRYEDLVKLFREWRAFEKPPFREGAPDYTQAAFVKRRPAFEQLRKRLNNTDTAGWSMAQQADWMIVWAEMNGYDFNQRILKPWQRDPAYYKTLWTERSDVPAHEGPTHHALLELWQYRFPLDEPGRNKLLKELNAINAINKQAQLNLTGNARDLWIAGIRDIRFQVDELQAMKQLPGVFADDELTRKIDGAITSTKTFIAWLEKEAKKKTGPSGIGKENYSWYQKNVHLLPMTWEDEMAVLKRELSRAWTALQQEEHRNRHLPAMKDAESPEEFNKLTDSAAKSLMRFLETKDIVTIKPYFEPALRERLGSFVPKEKRNFFWIATHYDPRPLYSHFYHWFELAQMDTEPHASEIRRAPLLYNIFDHRNEGLATAVEEWFMNAGLYDDSPRSREIVYIMIAQRAARGLGSLYAHANIMSMEEAGGIHSEYTPRSWMKTEKELQVFEQHLYLRQPGYGTSYITGKYMLENVMAEYSRILTANGKSFSLKQFMDGLNETGCIPVKLVAWEMLESKDVMLIK